MTRPYTYDRPYDPPPPPELIDALADQPLAPEIAECETCAHLADCRATYRGTGRFAQAECSRVLTRILPRDENVSDQLVMLELRAAPGTVAQLIERTTICEHSIYKIIRRLRRRGLVTRDAASGLRNQPRTYSLQEAQR